MKFVINVIQAVEVELDETKFTPEFMAEFRATFYNFKTLERHAQHIAQMEARSILRKEFTEGYGPLADFGIDAKVIDQIEETLE